MTAISLRYRNISNKITSFSLPKINWKLIYWSGIAVSLSMFVFYIYSVNKMTNSAYLAKGYGKEMDLLFKENRILEAQYTESELLGQFMDKAKGLSFEKTVNPKYVQILDNSLAKVPKNY